jgi:hypothetical protein
MGIVMLGLFKSNGINGAVMQMINHGIYSGALFLLVGIIYERRHTRKFPSLAVYRMYRICGSVFGDGHDGDRFTAAGCFIQSFWRCGARSKHPICRWPDWEYPERGLHAVAISACSLVRSRMKRTSCCRIKRARMRLCCRW